MKNKTSKFYAIRLLGLLTLILIAYGCRKQFSSNDTIVPATLNNEINLAALKASYSNDTTENQFGTFGTTNIKKHKMIIRDVLWSKIYYQKRDSSRIIEFDMQADQLLYTFGQMPQKCLNKNDLIFIEFNNGKKLNFYMLVSEDLSTDSLSSIKRVHYTSIPGNFTGQIMYYTLDRQFVNGYQYTKGKITAVYGPIKTNNNGPSVQSIPSKKVNGIDSYVYCEEVYNQNWYNGQSEWVDSGYQECTTVYYFTQDPITNPGTPPGNNPGSSPGNGGINGDTGGGGTTGNPSPCDPPATPPGAPGDSTINGSTSLHGIRVTGGYAVLALVAPDCPEKTKIIQVVSDSIQNQCLKDMVKSIISSINIQSTINNDLQGIYGGYGIPHLLIIDSRDLADNRDGETESHYDSVTGNLLYSVIKLNQNILKYASKEYIAATILHEGVHSILNKNPGVLNPINGEEDILKLVNNIAADLRNIFPSLSVEDARALSYGGLENTWEYSFDAGHFNVPDNYRITNSLYRNTSLVNSKGHGCLQ